MFEYFQKIIALLTKIEHKEKESIEKAISILTEANLNKNSIFIFGASHAGIMTEELYYRAGGMMTINPIFGREIMLDRSPVTLTSKMERLEGYGRLLASQVDFKKKDVLIIHSVSGRNPVALDIALAAKEKGAIIIALTNLVYSQSVTSRHSSEKKLYELADIILDNHGDIGDASCTIEGIQQKVGPTSTVIGASILNTIIVETCRRLVQKGIQYPPIFYSANLDGGDQLNQQLYKQYKDMIHYSF